MTTPGEVLLAVSNWRPDVVNVFEAVLPDLVDAGVLLPAVTDFRGCLLSASAITGNPHLEEWFEDRFTDAQREYVLNHLHLWDVVKTTDGVAVPEVVTGRLRALLPILAEFWTWHIAQQTDHAFDVWTADDPDEYGPTIGFGYER